MDKSYCPIRKKEVQLLPEEKVRLSFIQTLINELGFPENLLSVEVALHTLPHLKDHKELPECRADLICYATDIHPDHSLYPLLLVECKAVPLNAAAERQLVGYNYYVQAPFLALVGIEEVRLGYWDGKKYIFNTGISTFQQLVTLVKS